MVIGDGQVTLGDHVMKPNALKVRRLGEGGHVIVGFAGAAADCLTMVDRLESLLGEPESELLVRVAERDEERELREGEDQLARCCVEMAKMWRSDKYLRNLQVCV